MPNHRGQSRYRLRPSPMDTRRPGTPPRQLVIATAATVALAAAIWLSTIVETSPTLHDLALFAHLGSLILGFGTVLVADYFFALWVFGRTTFAEAVVNTSWLHPLIWAGLVGLITSGVLLKPDLTSTATILKLGLVAILTVNGIQASALGTRMSALAGSPTRRLLIRGGVTSAISQICWWGAIVIGFLSVNR